jgi:hypothetical protein
MCVLLAVLCCGGGIRWHCSAGDCGAAAEAVRRDGGAAARPPIAARRGANRLGCGNARVARAAAGGGSGGGAGLRAPCGLGRVGREHVLQP